MQTNDQQSQHVHPVVFLFLILPFGIVSGNLTVSVAYQLSQAGVPTTQIAELIALSSVPHVWKFLWAPVVDTTLTLKKWHLIAVVTSAIGLVAMNALPATVASMPQLFVIGVLGHFASTFAGMAVDALMAHGTPADLKGRAAGWFQAGNLGGAGLGGGAGLWIAQSTGQAWISGVVLGAVCLMCCAGLWFVVAPKPSHSSQGIVGNVLGTLKDFWDVARTRLGYLGLLICFLPIGSGAASNLWSAIAGDWHATAEAVATANGLMTGVCSAVGCIAGGYLCDRMDRKYAYALFGVLLAACAIGMALAPRTQPMYIAFVLIYAFISGLCYAAFSAVVLEAIGTGAAATKYNIFASLSNAPIAYMTVVLGWAHTRWDAASMLYVEAASGVIGVLLFAAVVRMSRR